MNKVKVVLLPQREIQEVAAGYARNFLFPRKKALPLTPTLLAQIQKEAEEKKQRAKQSKEADYKRIQELKGKTFALVSKANDAGTLFGALSEAEIAGVVGIPQEWINLSEPLKKLGEASVKIEAPHGEKCEIKIEVKAA